MSAVVLHRNANQAWQPSDACAESTAQSLQVLIKNPSAFSTSEDGTIFAPLLVFIGLWKIPLKAMFICQLEKITLSGVVLNYRF